VGLRSERIPSKRGPASIDGKRRMMLMGNKGKKKPGTGLAQREGLSLVITAMEEYAENSQVLLTTHEATMLSDLKAKLAARAPISREEGNRAFEILRSKDKRAAEEVLKKIKLLKK
jgi:hypothetical protein